MLHEEYDCNYFYDREKENTLTNFSDKRVFEAVVYRERTFSTIIDLKEGLTYLRNKHYDQRERNQI